MSQPAITRGTGLYIKMETAPGSGVFQHPCAINAKRGIKFTTQMNKIIVPDCTNPDDPAWQLCIKFGLAAAIDGAGKTNTADVANFMAYYASKDPRNLLVYIGAFGFWTGAFMCSNFEVSGDPNDYSENTIALDSHGTIAWTTA